MNPVQPPPPPSYQCVMAENNYLKHAMAYQNQLVWYHQQSAESLHHDAMRWRKFKELVNKEGDDKASKLQSQIDEELGKKE